MSSRENGEGLGDIYLLFQLIQFLLVQPISFGNYWNHIDTVSDDLHELGIRDFEASPSETHKM